MGRELADRREALMALFLKLADGWKG